MEVKIQHSIQLAAKRAGLTAHVIRAWEKRYDAVSPDRTDTNRRLYSEDEIERLRLLGVLTREGHRIGDIARIPTPDLSRMEAELGNVPRASHMAVSGFSEAGALNESIDAIRRMDADGLEAIVAGGAVALGQRGLLGRLISPLAQRIGELWASGSLSAAHEHFASSVLRQFVLRGSRSFPTGSNAPVMIVTTPAGQLHELGAAIVAATARDLGWRVVYLGPNLPAADIAHAAVANAARVVALSIVYPPDDPELRGELSLLLRLLPAETSIIAGGAAAPAYAASPKAAGIIVTDNLDELSGELAKIRASAAT